MKLEDREYLYKISQGDILKVEDKPTSFTAPMAAGWGLGRLEEYPILLEKARKLDPGTIWIGYWIDKTQHIDKRPQPGDFYVLQDAAGHFAHVGVIIASVYPQISTYCNIASILKRLR